MIIISAHGLGLTAELNARRSAKLYTVLCEIVGFDATIIPTEGVHNNTQEQCYIIRMDADCSFVRTEEIARKVFEAAVEFNQDCIGFINFESNPPRMGTIDCVTRSPTSYNVAQSIQEPPPEATNAWIKVLDYYYFPYGELTILDDLTGCNQIAGAEADILMEEFLEEALVTLDNRQVPGVNIVAEIEEQIDIPTVCNDCGQYEVNCEGVHSPDCPKDI